MSVHQPCPDCGRTSHPTIHVGSRFPMPLVPTYRGDYEGAPAFLTREEAARDLCRWRQTSGEVGTGAGRGDDRASAAEATSWVNGSQDCPEAPAQAHLPAIGEAS